MTHCSQKTIINAPSDGSDCKEYQIHQKVLFSANRAADGRATLGDFDPGHIRSRRSVAGGMDQSMGHLVTKRRGRARGRLTPLLGAESASVADLYLLVFGRTNEGIVNLVL